MPKNNKNDRKAKRKVRIRGKVSGTADRPRLAVSRTNKNTYAQIIDDEKMVTLSAVSSLTKEIKDKIAGKNKTEGAAIIGEEIAKRAVSDGLKKVAFDRGGNLYHGRIKALADAARKAGLEF
jgi:large subunit ribosomal protein L18